MIFAPSFKINSAAVLLLKKKSKPNKTNQKKATLRLFPQEELCIFYFLLQIKNSHRNITQCVCCGVGRVGQKPSIKIVQHDLTVQKL